MIINKIFLSYLCIFFSCWLETAAQDSRIFHLIILASVMGYLLLVSLFAIVVWYCIAKPNQINNWNPNRQMILSLVRKLVSVPFYCIFISIMLIFWSICYYSFHFNEIVLLTIFVIYVVIIANVLRIKFTYLQLMDLSIWICHLKKKLRDITTYKATFQL